MRIDDLSKNQPYIDLEYIHLQTETEEKIPVFGVGESSSKGSVSYRFNCSVSEGAWKDNYYPNFNVKSSSTTGKNILNVAFPVLPFCTETSFVKTTKTIGIESEIIGNIDIEVTDQHSRIKFLNIPSTFNLVFIVPTGAINMNLIGIPGLTVPASKPIRKVVSRDKSDFHNVIGNEFIVQGIECKIASVKIGNSYEGLRPYNPDAKPENDGVLIIKFIILNNEIERFPKLETWIENEAGERNQKGDESGLTKYNIYTLLYNVPKESKNIILFIDGKGIDLSKYLVE